MLRWITVLLHYWKLRKGLVYVKSRHKIGPTIEHVQTWNSSGQNIFILSQQYNIDWAEHIWVLEI